MGRGRGGGGEEKEVESANERVKRVLARRERQDKKLAPPCHTGDYSPEEGPTRETLLAVVSRS